MFHSFFFSILKLDPGTYPSFCSFQFYSAVSKVHNSTSCPFIMTRSGCLAVIRWSVCISKSQSSLCVSFSSTDSGLCIYHLFAWSNFNFFRISEWTLLRWFGFLIYCPQVILEVEKIKIRTNASEKCFQKFCIKRTTYVIKAA